MQVKELLKKIVSKERGQKLITRYSVPFGIVIAATLWAYYLNLTKAYTLDTRVIATVSFSLAFGLFWAAAQQLSEYRMRKDNDGKLLPKPILIQVLGQIVIVSLITFLCYKADTLETATLFGMASICVAMLAGISLLPFWKQKTDRHLVRWNVDFSITGVVCYAIVGLTIALCMLLIYGIDELFEITISEKIIGMTLSTITILGGGSLLLLLLPDAEKTNKVSQIGERFSDKIGNYLLLPVTCLYLLVLYAYIVKIIIAGELPNGGVSWMTIAMMAITFGTLFLRYKAFYAEDDTTFNKAVRLGLPLATLPCLILMSIGFIRRISDYGWTPTRGYLCAVIAWFFFAVGLLLWADWQKRKGHSPRIISLLAISAVLLFLVTSAIPKANIYTICTAVQREDIPAAPKTWSESHKTFFNLSEENTPIPIPEGYTSFRKVEEFDYRESTPKRDDQGRLILEFRDRNYKWYTVHFDDGQTGDNVKLYTDDNQLIIAHGLTIVDHEGKLYINYLYGYIFEK